MKLHSRAFSNTASKTVSAVAAGLLLVAGALEAPSHANSNNASSLRQGLPGRRISGGVRDQRATSCFTNFDQSLVSVIPHSNLGTTAKSHPTFWFSLPETNGQKSVEFRLYDETDTLIYSTPVNTSNEYGLSEFQLPETAPALAVNETYRWALTLSCNSTSQSPVLGLDGWVRRVDIAPNLSSQLSTASAEERIGLYRTAGIWQEQVTELLTLRRNNIDDIELQLEWAALIQPTGLTSHLANNITDNMTAIETTALSAPTEQYLERAQ
ncbi:MAG: DUF928 domain-containing protein [Cyanobacteria bacterium J06632_3]